MDLSSGGFYCSCERLIMVKREAEHEPEVIRVQEFAQRLQISVWTARQWAYRGKIASCKAGKHLLIPASEIARLIAANTRPRVQE